LESLEGDHKGRNTWNEVSFAKSPIGFKISKIHNAA